MRYSLALGGLAALLCWAPPPAQAGVVPVSITVFSKTNNQVALQWTPAPASDRYRVQRVDSLADPFLDDPTGFYSDFTWAGTNAGPVGFYRVQVTPLSDDALLAANALNRIAYGPTPDELDRILTGPSPIGPAAYIAEQLAPQSIPDDLDSQSPRTEWTYVTATGTATAGRLYLYLSAPGSAYVDDVAVVKGTEPEAGPNLIANGGFESALLPKWISTANFSGSAQSGNQSHSGSKSLLLVGTAAGSGSGNALYQDFSGFVAGQIYTLSFWYLPTNENVKLTVRLSGTDVGKVDVALAPALPPITAAYQDLQSLKGGLGTLRSWFVQRAIRSPRQLLEVMSQWVENHFVTEYTKSLDYFDRFYDDSALMDRLATSLEFREMSKWRAALLKPDCAFKDLLRISAESPAQIIYLDTVDSRGDGNNIANENYSREVLELDTFGVDNGYDQQDIVAMSKAWTGWALKVVDPPNIDNPLALQTTNKLDYTLTNQTALTSISNLSGVWTFGFRSSRHNAKEKIIFPNKTVPARFGQPWAGRNYQLKLLARAGNDGINDGYDVINHLADQPFTQEFISVKLCRLLVHDNFQHGVYDYTDLARLSEEGRLVHSCMLAWETGSPKGQIWKVLKVILDSDLFRKNGGSMQKVKTPLEFCVSAIRALRSDLGNGRFSASSDGVSIVGTTSSSSSSPLIRMGVMRLFNRVEPDGYPEAGAGWISGGTLAERAHFVEAFLMGPSDSAKLDGMGITANVNLANPVGLLRARLPAAQWSDPSAVASLFLRLLFPAEGAGNLEGYRATATRFLDTSDSGATASPFKTLDPTSAAYDTRVRSMVALLMTSPRFQEQ
ncbi:MAG: DUF1800 family protein [Verrucomicrobia bacterium]|nr:DUF1800 family protein [Verrucomicrobiota bacterium]MBI3871106.1 DUF1800 family protein [Verrucomicrobiota bacterium]